MNQLRFAWIPILLAGQALCAGQSRADAWQNAWSARLAAEFDTNPAMSPAYPGSVRRALFEPAYSLTARAGENDLKAGLGARFVRSSNSALDPDRNNPAGYLDWMHRSAGGEFGLSARYTELATREAGIDSTGLASAASTRTTRTFAGIWNNRLGERSTLAADGAYDKVTYKGGRYVDYSAQAGSLKFSYALSETATPFCRVSGIKYVPANDTPTSGLADGTLGVGGKAQYTDWTLLAGAAKVTDVETIAEGLAETRFTGERTQWSLHASRLVLPSGLGAFVKADQARASWRYALSEYDDAGVDLEARKNLPVTINGEKTRSTLSDVWLSHDLAPSWKLRMYYRHWINQVNGNENVTSNILGLSIAYDSSAIGNSPSNPNPERNHD